MLGAWASHLSLSRPLVHDGLDAPYTWQSDVGTARCIIEDEFYEAERLLSRSDFLAKAGAYNLWVQHRAPQQRQGR